MRASTSPSGLPGWTPVRTQFCKPGLFDHWCAISALDTPAVHGVFQFGDSESVRFSAGEPTRAHMSVATIAVVVCDFDATPSVIVEGSDAFSVEVIAGSFATAGISSVSAST